MSASGIREAGDAALILDLDDSVDPRVNARAIAIAAAIREARVPGVRDVVPTIRSVAVYFDPLAVDLARLSSVVDQAHGRAGSAVDGPCVEVPIAYGGTHGPDLAGVAAFAGVPESRVVELHAAREYRVFMLGFLPGFPYLGIVDARIAAPRHASPRRRVPAGSVGIAGQQTGIYPRDSPGGWQIVGHTALTLFDRARTPPFLLAPGDRVRFVPVPAGELEAGSAADRRSGGAAASFARRASTFDLPVTADKSVPRDAGHDAEVEDPAPGARRVTVLAPGLLTTVQDLGRWGHQSGGVSVAGPMDPFSHRLANSLVGNSRHAAALEITLSGPQLRLEHDAVIAVTGADLEPTLDARPVQMNEAVACRSGSVLRFGGRRSGARSYLAFDGGVRVPPVLGSRSTHVLSGLGGLQGRALRTRDTIVLGQPVGRPERRRTADLPPAAAGGTLRVLAGPQESYLPASAIGALVSGQFELAAESDRMGYRLKGARIETHMQATMISGPTFTGGIQVPPSGEPVLLMADRQTTGGYPQIATVIAADVPAAGQLAPGDRVRFVLCSRSEAISALVRQEGMLLALE